MQDGDIPFEVMRAVIAATAMRLRNGAFAPKGMVPPLRLKGMVPPQLSTMLPTAWAPVLQAVCCGTNTHVDIVHVWFLYAETG